jgi:hypothetical protein
MHSAPLSLRRTTTLPVTWPAVRGLTTKVRLLPYLNLYGTIVALFELFTHYSLSPRLRPCR